MLEVLVVPLGAGGTLSEAMPSQKEQDNVLAVLQEAEHPSYWVSASKDGNRETHYRGVYSAIHDVRHTRPSSLPNRVANMITALA